MTNKKRYSITYDKYVPNRFGGVDCERCIVSSNDRRTAVKVMKNDLYNNGCYGSRGVARYKNGKVERVQPRKAPVINMDETLRTSVRRERLNARHFGQFK